MGKLSHQNGLGTIGHELELELKLDLKLELELELELEFKLELEDELEGEVRRGVAKPSQKASALRLWQRGTSFRVSVEGVGNCAGREATYSSSYGVTTLNSMSHALQEVGESQRGR